MTFRSFLLVAHRWVSILLSVPFIVLGISGALISFEAEIDRALAPQLWATNPSFGNDSWERVVEVVRREYPDQSVGSLRVPTGGIASPDWAAEVSLRNGLLVYVDPRELKINGTRRRGDMPMVKFHQFHTNLQLGKNGALFNGICTLAMLGVSLSGIYLWWRTKIWKVVAGHGFRRWNFDLHHALGLWGLGWWLLMALTGVMMTFYTVTEPALNWLTGAPHFEPPQVHSTVKPGAAHMTADAAIAAAESALPGEATALVSFAKKPDDPVVVFMKFPEDRTPAGRSRVYLDAYSGEKLAVTSTRDVPFGNWLWFQHRSLHTGDWWGWPTRIIYFLMSALLAVQTVTGLIMWWQRTRKVKAAAARTATNQSPAAN